MWKLPITVLLTSLTLVACGGDNGGGGTPPGSGDTGDKAAAGSITAVQLAVLSKFSMDPSSGSKRVAPKANCPNGGTFTSAQDNRDVNSPFTDQNFDVTDSSFEECTTSSEQNGFSQTTVLNGLLSAGIPEDGNDEIVYSEFGANSAPFGVDLFTDDSNNGTTTDAQLELAGRFDGLFQNEGAIFDFRSSLAFGGNIATSTPQGSSQLSFTARLGENADPFAVDGETEGNDLLFNINGPAFFESPQLPADCVTGSIEYDTLQTVRVTPMGPTAGRIRVTTDEFQAEVQFLSDGSTEVTVNGDTQMLSEEELEQLQARCDVFSGVLASSVSGGSF